MVYLVSRHTITRFRNDQELEDFLTEVCKTGLTTTIHQIIYDFPTDTWQVWDGGSYDEVCVL